MNILIIGTGYVGTSTALVFAELGHKVIGLDTDIRKIDELNRGKLHFYEKGLDHLFYKHLEKGNVQFTTDTEQAIKKSKVIFICVGTPNNDDGSANLQFVEQVARNIGHFINNYKVIVIKSTVPVGVSEKVREWIAESKKNKVRFDVVSNPEFLREGSALWDAMHPDRIVIGSRSEKATLIVSKLYQSLNALIIVTTPQAAELIKYASNAFLATKISFINEMAKLCDKLDINILQIAEGMGMDHRIGPYFLEAGIGYGGSCFPKDLNALLDTAKRKGVPLSLLEKVVDINQTQPLYVIEKLKNKLRLLKKKRICVLGLSFKPETDDTRESRAFPIIRELINQGAEVAVHDPIVQLSDDMFQSSVKQFETEQQATQKVDAVIICTNWSQYIRVDWKEILINMSGNVLLDGRNMLNAQEMKEIGFDYEGVGYK